MSSPVISFRVTAQERLELERSAKELSLSGPNAFAKKAALMRAFQEEESEVLLGELAKKLERLERRSKGDREALLKVLRVLLLNVAKFPEHQVDSFMEEHFK